MVYHIKCDGRDSSQNDRLDPSGRGRPLHHPGGEEEEGRGRGGSALIKATSSFAYVSGKRESTAGKQIRHGTASACTHFL